MNQFAVVGSRLLVSLLDQAFPKAALLVAAIPKDSTTVAPSVPGDQRFGRSDCTLAGSGEGRCDREGAAADLVVGGPGGVGGQKSGVR